MQKWDFNLGSWMVLNWYDAPLAHRRPLTNTEQTLCALRDGDAPSFVDPMSDDDDIHDLDVAFLSHFLWDGLKRSSHKKASGQLQTPLQKATRLELPFTHSRTTGRDLDKNRTAV